MKTVTGIYSFSLVYVSVDGSEYFSSKYTLEVTNPPCGPGGVYQEHISLNSQTAGKPVYLELTPSSATDSKVETHIFTSDRDECPITECSMVNREGYPTRHPFSECTYDTSGSVLTTDASSFAGDDVTVWLKTSTASGIESSERIEIKLINKQERLENVSEVHTKTKMVDEIVSTSQKTLKEYQDKVAQAKKNYALMHTKVEDEIEPKTKEINNEDAKTVIE